MRCGRYQSRMQLGLDQKGVEVVGRQRVVDLRRGRQRARQIEPVKRDQEIGGVRIALDHRPRRIAFDHELVAEILEHDEAGVVVGGVNLRRREAARAQRERHRDERLHVLGEMRDRAVGQSALHRRPVGLARPVHQDDGAAVRDEALIGAARGVAGDPPAHGRRRSPRLRGSDGPWRAGRCAPPQRAAPVDLRDAPVAPRARGRGASAMSMRSAGSAPPARSGHSMTTTAPGTSSKPSSASSPAPVTR